MIAIQQKNLTVNPVAVDIPFPTPKSGQRRLWLKAAALNKRDDWICQGLYPGIVLNCTLGSDACGVDEKGEPFVVCPSINWGDKDNVQGPNYSILGMPTPGTFAEQICIADELLFKKPERLSFDEAAALPLAGLTAWRALMTQAGCKSTDRVLITGIGGGVALFAMQFAIAKGCETWVSSSSDQKIRKALEMGANGGFRYDKKERPPGRFDVIIDSAGGDGFGDLIKALSPGGRLAFYGGTRGKWPAISPQSLFFKQAHIIGSTMGSPTEFGEMLRFVDKESIVPIVDSTFQLTDFDNAMKRLRSPERFGKVALIMPD